MLNVRSLQEKIKPVNVEETAVNGGLENYKSENYLTIGTSEYALPGSSESHREALLLSPSRHRQNRSPSKQR